jgi:chemotaxis signal transduction protein
MSKIIYLKVNFQKVGILVDDVIEVKKIHVQNIEQISGNFSQNGMNNNEDFKIVHTEEGIVTLLDTDRLFKEK